MLCVACPDGDRMRVSQAVKLNVKKVVGVSLRMGEFVCNFSGTDFTWVDQLVSISSHCETDANPNDSRSGTKQKKKPTTHICGENRGDICFAQ